MLSGDFMNNKGFTLVEVLATVVILGLVMGIGITSVSNAINNSKNTSEDIFVDKFKDAIIQYLDLYGIELGVKNTSKYTFNKCIKGGCYDEGSDTYINGTYYSSEAIELNSLKVSSLIDKGILTESSIVNPANKKKCFNGIDPSIRVFRDDDFVYYFYINLGGGNNTCRISSPNSIITTLPKALADEVGL